ncbi:PH domain-containing protein [Knoellia sp. CPCC 206450]|uniref:PH domain-containing protein n=1 Tax=Knoellia tibetensis TaxID=3404798 RepID=UPI003B4340C7
MPDPDPRMPVADPREPDADPRMPDADPGVRAADPRVPELHEWQHLHPLSPILRGGLVGVAILGYAGSQFVDDLFSGLGGGGEGDEGSERGLREGLAFLFDHSLAAAAAIVAVLAVIGLVGWLTWRFSKFRVAAGQIELRKGWLFREHRQVPLERVQAIEISRPLLAQITGLSQVIVQSAGGGDSHLRLAFLGARRAEEVRRQLLALAGRRDEAGPTSAAEGGAAAVGRAEPGHAAPGQAAPGQVAPGQAAPGQVAPGLPATGLLDPDEGREVLRVPNSRLFVATILHGGTILLGAVALVTAGVALAAYGSTLEALTGAAIALPALGPLAFGIAVNRVGELLKHGNFRLGDTGTAARVQHGLTDKRTTTIPLHRIQAVGMVQPLWWRPVGWWRVHVNVAGIGQDPSGGSGDDDTTVLPVGTLDQALEVLALLDPALSADDLRQAALGEGGEAGWTTVSERARILDPLSWRRNGFAVSAHSLMVRTGRFWRRVSVMPHARVQSLTLSQGPIDRRLDLATVTLVSTPGPVSVQVQHLEAGTATGLLRDEAGRSRAARQISGTACTTDAVPSQLEPPAPHDER